MINSDVDVIFGCGNPDFNSDGEQESIDEYKYVGGKSTWNKLKSNKMRRKLITSKKDFDDLFISPKNTLLLGVPEVNTTLQAARSGDVGASAFEIPKIEGIPSLIDLSLSALQCLNINKNGFFIMIEGGAVDWAAHSNHSGRMIEELIEFNITVDSVVNWVETNSSWDETLLIITSDHETGYLTGNNGYKSRVKPNGKGKMPDMSWNSGGHTNVLIPLFAKGNGSELFDDYADEVDSLRGYFIQNTEIGQVMFRAFK